tara:strand:+ start:3618 stop:4763 length:1146 start_codon:yes stop_codon:yes gene_type:complete
MALEYQKVGTETRFREETNTIEQDIGFEEISICRPSFFFFDFTGLKPSSPHWFFLDGVDVTKYINTSFTLNSYNNADRNSLLRTPGDAYVSETQFPAAQGGPTNGGSGPVNTDAAGNLSGAFYLQSNTTTSFIVGTKILQVIDVSSNDKTKALSYSQTEFEALGLYDLYYETRTTTTVSYEEDIYDWVEVPDPVPPASSSSSNNQDDNNREHLSYSHYEPPADKNFWDPGYFTEGYTTTYTTGQTYSQIQEDRSSTTGSGQTSSGGGKTSSGCCFIMLEARYGDGTMDKVVRRYRDEFMTDKNRRGYYKLAEVLVPLMRKSKAVKWIVSKTMTDPLVAYGKYYYGENKTGVIFTPVKNFWMKLFDTLGGDTKFIRENGEVV